MSLFDQLLVDSRAKRELLAELYPYDPSGAVVVPLYFSMFGFAGAPTDVLPNQPYAARIQPGLTITRSMYQPDRIGGRSAPDYGSLVLNNPDGGLDYLRAYAWDGRRMVLRLGGTLGNGTVLAYSDYGIVFDGTASGDAVVTERNLTVRLAGSDFKFEQPIQQTLYTGAALHFDGVTGCATSSFQFPAGGMTVECWVYPDTSSSSVKIFQEVVNGASAGLRSLRFGSSGANLPAFVVRNDAATAFTLNASVTCPVGQWSHVAGVLDVAGSQLLIYVNGTVAGTLAVTGTFNTRLSNHAVGKSPSGGLFFDGRVDGLRVWSATRTAAQLNQYKYIELLGVETSLSGLWQCNEGSGTTTADITGGGKTLTLNGAATWGVGDWVPDHLAGKPKPLCYGEVLELEPELIDPATLVYQWHESTSQALLAVYDKGLALAPAGYAVDLQHSLMILAAAPAGKITLGARGDASGSGYVNTTAGIMRRIATRAGLVADPAGLSTASFVAADTANGAVVGIYIKADASVPKDELGAFTKSSRTTAQVLDELAAGVGFFYGFTRATNLLQVGRFAAPTGSAVASYDESQILNTLIEVVPLLLPVGQVIVGYGRNYGFQDGGQVAGALSTTPARFAFATNEWRFTAYPGVPAKVPYAQARRMVVLSCFLSKADADAEALRLFNLYSVHRDLYRVPLHSEPLARDVNDEISLTRSRLGLDSGADFIVLGFEETMTSGVVKAQVWK